MGRKLAFGLAAAAALWLAGPPAPASAETLNWVTYKPQSAGDAQQISMQWFADELSRRTKGEWKARIHWGGSVAGPNEIPNAVGKGLGDMGDIIVPYFPDQMLLNNAISYIQPQRTSAIEGAMLMQFWHDTIPAFSAEMEKLNLKVLSFRPIEAYGLICTRPVKSVADLKGLRIRAFGFGLPAVVKALGAVPMNVTTNDTYEALERKIIDCSPIGPVLASGFKLDEVAKYYIDIPLGVVSYGHFIAMNTNKFKALPKEVQTELESIGREHLVRYIALSNVQEVQVRKRWKDTGKVEVIPFPAAEFSAAIAASDELKKLHKEWSDRARALGVDPEPIVQRLAVK
ncbi:MAG: TRAP transporter substrate-binding protein DctP [Reyranellaceae bacterium]